MHPHRAYPVVNGRDDVSHLLCRCRPLHLLEELRPSNVRFRVNRLHQYTPDFEAFQGVHVLELELRTALEANSELAPEVRG